MLSIRQYKNSKILLVTPHILRFMVQVEEYNGKDLK